MHKFIKYVFSDQSVCVICNENDERPTSKLGEKGCQGLIAASSLKGIIYMHYNFRIKKNKIIIYCLDLFHNVYNNKKNVKFCIPLL